MAIGDKTDIYNRLISQLPKWFGDEHPILDALLQAYVGYNDDPSKITSTLFHFNQYVYASAQMRVQTATDINLDLISQDYLGDTLPRKINESDATYRKRILANLLMPRVTVSAMKNALKVLTGYEPVIVEPWQGYHGYYDVPSTLAYRTYGGYGSGISAYQAWIYVTLSGYKGLGNYPCYNLLSFATAVSVASGGAGYAVGDEIGLENGVSNPTPPPVALKVLSTDPGGAVTSIEIIQGGLYSEPLPTNPLAQAVTSGSGTGATFNVTTWKAHVPTWGYADPSTPMQAWYGSSSLTIADVTEDDARQVIERTKLAGTLMHVFFTYDVGN